MISNAPFALATVSDTPVRATVPERSLSKPPFFAVTERSSPFWKPPPIMVIEAVPAVSSAAPVEGPLASKTVIPPIFVVPSSPSSPAGP